MAQTYKRGEFCNYLSRFKVEKGSEFTHTSIIKPLGAFYIPTEEMENFYSIYKRAFSSGEDLYLTEKHRDISPFLIDLDFRFEKTDTLQRVYTNTDVQSIIKLYMQHIQEYVDIPCSTMVYLLEKPHPSVEKGLVKDGIHIIIPEVVTKPSVQFIVREKILKDIEPVLHHLNLQNRIEDVVDEAVIERNNWQMYGSKKPNSTAYAITKQFCWEKATGSLVDLNITMDDAYHTNMVEELSIRNKYDLSSIKIDKKEEIQQYEANHLKKKKPAMNPALQSSQNNKKNIVENLEHVQKIVDILSEERANTYTDWIRVGWCLRNIDYRLLPSWIDFSKKSPKFQDGECEKLWNYMRDDGLGIGTLYMWAKKDNPERYQEILNSDISSLIHTSRNETHYDIARVVHFMFKHEYVCASIKSNFWYEFRNNRWVPCDSGYTLNNKLSTDVFRRYSAAAAQYHNRAATTENETEQSVFTETAKKLTAITTKLKTVSFKENIMSECKRLFYVEKFEEKLDAKCHLVGFENGVYDLDAQEFREGRAEDFISFSTGINYIPYDPTHPFAIQVQNFLKQVLPKDHIREYVITLLASFLNGHIKEERFHIWTGVGSNGKSKLIDLFEQSFGEYCGKFPVTLLTQKRAASNAATTELAKAKGKRFMVLQEPSEDEKMNVGLMKELSGGDKIQARAIFKEPIEFKPQFKLVLTCNHLPNVPSDDGGTWRRIRVVGFTSRFTHNPDPEKENEFPIDTELSMRFCDWREHFMALLVQSYKNYVEVGVKEPDEVLECTREYQRTNDFYLDFFESEIEPYEMGFLSTTDAYNMFKAWQKDNIPTLKVNKGPFVTGLSKICGKKIAFNKTEGWKGFRVKPFGQGDETDDL